MSDTGASVSPPPGPQTVAAPPPSAPPSAPPPPPPSSGPDWTVTVSDRIETVVGTVRDKTTVPVTKAVRAMVFGLVAGVAGVIALVMSVIAIIRLHVYLPFRPVGRQLWTSYAVLGAIFLLIGAFTWRKRRPKE